MEAEFSYLFPYLSVSARQHIIIYVCRTRYAIARPPVYLSHRWISQKRLKLGSCNFHHRVPQSIYFCIVSLVQKFWRVPPERGRQTRMGWGKQAVI